MNNIMKHQSMRMIQGRKKAVDKIDETGENMRACVGVRGRTEGENKGSSEREREMRTPRGKTRGGKLKKG